jgi:hypothetical protein
MAPLFTGSRLGFGRVAQAIRIPEIIQVTIQIAGAGGQNGGVRPAASGGLTNATITVPDAHAFQLYVASNISPNPSNYVQGGSGGASGGGGSALLLTNSQEYSGPNYLLIGVGGGGGGVTNPGVTYAAGDGGGGDNPGTPPPSSYGAGGTGNSSATNGGNAGGPGGPLSGGGGGGFSGGGGGGGAFSSNVDDPSYWVLSGGAGGGGNIITGSVPGVSGAPVVVALNSASTAGNPNSPGYCTFTTPSKVTPYSSPGVYTVPVASLI